MGMVETLHHHSEVYAVVTELSPKFREKCVIWPDDQLFPVFIVQFIAPFAMSLWNSDSSIGQGWIFHTWEYLYNYYTIQYIVDAIARLIKIPCGLSDSANCSLNVESVKWEKSWFKKKGKTIHLTIYFYWRQNGCDGYSQWTSSKA